MISQDDFFVTTARVNSGVSPFKLTPFMVNLPNNATKAVFRPQVNSDCLQEYENFSVFFDK